MFHENNEEQENGMVIDHKHVTANTNRTADSQE